MILLYKLFIRTPYFYNRSLFLTREVLLKDSFRSPTFMVFFIACPCFFFPGILVSPSPSRIYFHLIFLSCSGLVLLVKGFLPQIQGLQGLEFYSLL